MATITTAKLGVSLKLDDNTIIDLKEGDIVNELTYKQNGVEKAISGAVRVIDATTRSNSTIPDDCPPEPYAHRYITATSMVIDSSTEFDAELTRISCAAITGIGSVTENGGIITVGVGGQYKALEEVIAEAEAGATIKLADGEFTAPVTVTKSLTLIGSANTVLSGAINVQQSVARTTDASSIEVHLENLTLTGDALIKIQGAEAFTMKNCKFAGHTITTDRTYPVYMKSTTPILVTVDGCEFGAQDTKSYNLFEMDAPLKNGSSFSNNHFAKDCCQNNMICIYEVEDGAVINIENNTCEYSGNMVRIGPKGAANCTININGNAYDSTIEGDYQGLVLVQPYGAATTSMAGVTVNLNDTTMPTENNERQIYMYSGGSDMKFTEETMPTIYEDGKLITPYLIQA